MPAQTVGVYVMFVLVCLALANEAQVVVQDNTVLHVLVGYVNETRTQLVINGSATTSSLPGGSNYVYVNRMTRAQAVSAANGNAILSPYSFSEYALVRLYNREYVFFGDVPREYKAHVDEECNVSVNVSIGLAAHNIKNGMLCGWQNVGFRVWVNCEEPGNDNILSLKELGLGYHLRNGTLCVLRGRNNLDHMSSVSVVFVLFAFLTVWTQWTKHLWSRMDESDDIYTQICGYYTIVADVILIIVNVNVYNAVTHDGAYNFTSGRMVSYDTLYWTQFVYGCIVSPLVGAGVLATLSVRNADEHVKTVYFGWGLPFVEVQPLWYRCAITLVVLTCTLGIIVAAIVYGATTHRWAYVTTVTSIAFVAHRSTPTFLSHQLGALHLDRYWDPLLITTRWGVQFLLLTCALNHFPVEDSGLEFTGFCSIALGLILLATTARDGACLLHLQPNIVTVYMFTVMSAFLIWYVSIFCLGNALFANSDALINKTALSLECAITVCTVLLVGVLIASCPSPSPPSK